MLSDFKKFALKGSVLELAVAVILGIAFGLVINSFVNDVLMNVIAAFLGRPDFSDLTWTVGKGVIAYGAFLTALVNFLLVAFALFLVIKAAAKAMHKGAEPDMRDCPMCLSPMPVNAKRCAHCTADVAPLIAA